MHKLVPADDDALCTAGVKTACIAMTDTVCKSCNACASYTTGTFVSTAGNAPCAPCATDDSMTGVKAVRNECGHERHHGHGFVDRRHFSAVCTVCDR